MTQLRRELSLFDLTPSLIAHELQAPGWILLAWICGGLMALSGALTLSELGAMMPEAGGIYVYTGGIAALGIAFATYLSSMIPLGSAGITGPAIAGISIFRDARPGAEGGPGRHGRESGF